MPGKGVDVSIRWRKGGNGSYLARDRTGTEIASVLDKTGLAEVHPTLV